MSAIYSNCIVAILHPFSSIIAVVCASNDSCIVAKIVVESNTVIGRLPKVLVDAVTELSKPVPVMVIWVCMLEGPNGGFMEVIVMGIHGAVVVVVVVGSSVVVVVVSGSMITN